MKKRKGKNVDFWRTSLYNELVMNKKYQTEIKQPETREDYSGLVRRHNERLFSLCGKTPTAHIRTFGCQQNVSDSEKLAGMLSEMGYAMTEEPLSADIVLFNTCAVRENAEDRVFGNVGALKAAKEQNRDMIIVLCGCMTQQPHIAKKLKTSYPYVDLIFGTHSIGRLPELLWKKLSQGGRFVDISQEEPSLKEDLPVLRDGSIRAWVPVMYGCNNFCTYCVVPLVRGRERSRELSDIVREVEGLIQAGYKEIGLLGQNVNSYGKTLNPPVSFAQLLETLNALPGEFIIRFMTSHPKDCTRELIDTIARCEKVCNHIHLPVQSGSNRILKAMNRRYTAEQYLELIDYAREKIPGVSFTSDIIVGFPGETEEDFEATYRLIERVRYHSLFTFLYSKREGTKAADLPDDTPYSVKQKRFDRMLALQRNIGMEHHQNLVGHTVRVLAEGKGKTAPGRLTGKNEQGVIVEFDGEESLIGNFVSVRVTQALQWAVVGTAETME